MNCEEYADLVAADVDDALEADERGAAARHRATCGACATLREQQLAMRARLRRLPARQMPEDVRTRVLAGLDREDAKPATSGGATVLQFVSRRRFLLVGALAASLALLIVPTGRFTQSDLVAQLVQDAKAAAADEIAFAVRSVQVEDVRAYFTAQTLDFERTVPDLTPLGYIPIGATVDRSGDAAAAVTVFRGSNGTIVCRRLPLDAVEIPADAERFGDAFVITTDGVTMRFVRDGDALCSLASTMPRKQFLRELGLVQS